MGVRRAGARAWYWTQKATELLAPCVSLRIATTRFWLPQQVITGWLGSGKTTLLNHLLQADHGHRLAVIENEFGEVDVDSDLVSIKEDLVGQGGEGEEQIMMLNNGCLCCTVRDDLVDMLGKLVRKGG